MRLFVHKDLKEKYGILLLIISQVIKYVSLYRTKTTYKERFIVINVNVELLYLKRFFNLL